MPEAQRTAAPYLAFQLRNFRLYFAGHFITVLGTQMLNVGFGWEIYARTHSATALGLVGLCEALPVIALAIPAGHVADRYNRKLVTLAMTTFVLFVSVALALLSLNHAAIPHGALLDSANAGLTKTANLFGEHNVQFTEPVVPLMFLMMFLGSVAGTFYGPARTAMLPNIVPPAAFNNAVTWSSSAWQAASVLGPMLGGIVIATTDTYALVYIADAIGRVAFILLLLPIAYHHVERIAEEVTIKTLVAGFRFVRETKIILATITLDLFAVLLGGATALLPMFAKDILMVGPAGLGWLRAAPSIGAVATGFIIAHRKPMERAGRALLWAVIGFGAATIVFGLSHNFWLSLAVLVLAGGFDQISVVVRHTLVQVLTPDALRGRVSAVNSVFIGASNELGAFESGLTAAIFGPVISVVGGGIGTIVVVIVIMMVWPEIRKFGSLHQQ